MSFLDSTGLAYFYQKLKDKFVATVNGQHPEDGEVTITNVATADNLTAPDAQGSYDLFSYRTSGGSTSIQNGEAQLLYVDGTATVNGEVEENLSIVAPENLVITYNLNEWRAEIATTGDYIFNYIKPSSSTAVSVWNAQGTWSFQGTQNINISDYGIYVENLENSTLSITTSNNQLTVQVVPDEWVNKVEEDGVYDFVYASDESGNFNWYLDSTLVDISEYGITMTGTIEEGNTIQITYLSGSPNFNIIVQYTAPVRGAISIPKPTAFRATGLNQFDKETMFIENAIITNNTIIENIGTYVCYCKAVGGVTNGYVAYSEGGHIQNIGWSASLPQFNDTVVTDNKTVAEQISSIEFDNNGYVIVVVDNMDDLVIRPTWSIEGPLKENDELVWYEPYTAPSVINFPQTGIVQGTGETKQLPLDSYGMPAVGHVADRLNLDTKTYIQYIGHKGNTPSEMAEVISQNTPYIYDENNIYYVLDTPIIYNVEVDSVYTVNDFGTEEFVGASEPLGSQILYGQNLRDKLRTDVVTISQQSLNATQQQQIRTNINAANANDFGYKTYTSVEKLGLVVGEATISQAFTLLPNNSMLIAPAAEFLSTERPLPQWPVSSITIFKGNSEKSHWIECHGDSSGYGDYRMYLNDLVPSGQWVQIMDRNQLNSILSGYLTVTSGTTNITTKAGASGDATFTIKTANTNWYPLCIAGFDIQNTGSNSSNMGDCYIKARANGSATVLVRIRNESDTNRTWPVVVYILWRKISN